MTRPAWRHATVEELLAQLATVEQDLWARGGLHRQRYRRDLLAAALAAGCTLDAVAEVLGVRPSDVRAWLPVA